MLRAFLAFICLLNFIGPSSAEEVPSLLQPGKKILFLGDSNTYAGRYIVELEAQLRYLFPKKQFTLLNLGLPSETASGLSEPDHPFPRPDVHERAERALSKVKPDVVFVCYGMNDGIYYPFSKERFEAYQKGISSLMDKIKAVNAKVVLLTPPPFDPVPLIAKKKLRPMGAEKYAWFAPYEKYNDVLKRYAEWILTRHNQVAKVIDIYSPIQNHLDEQRKSKPEYALAGDGVHPNAKGHQLIAHAILRAFDLKPADEMNKELVKRIAQKQQILRDAWLSHVGHKRPGVRKGLPLSEAQKKAEAIDKK